MQQSEIQAGLKDSSHPKLKPVMADSSSRRKAMQIRSFHCSQLEEMVPPQSTIRLDQIKKLPTAFVLSCHHQEKKKQKKIYKIFLLYSGKKKKMAHPSFLSGSPPSTFFFLLFIQLLCIELVFLSLPLLFVLSQYASHQAFLKKATKKLFSYLILWSITVMYY